MNIKAKEVNSSALEQPSDTFENKADELVVETTVETSVDIDIPDKNETVPVSKEAKSTTMKLIVWLCLLNGIAWVWCSYILAVLGKEQIAESLSQVALTEIIGVVLVYAVKSVFENLSKNNLWPDKPNSDLPMG